MSAGRRWPPLPCAPSWQNPPLRPNALAPGALRIGSSHKSTRYASAPPSTPAARELCSARAPGLPSCPLAANTQHKHIRTCPAPCGAPAPQAAAPPPPAAPPLPLPPLVPHPAFVQCGPPPLAAATAPSRSSSSSSAGLAPWPRCWCTRRVLWTTRLPPPCRPSTRCASIASAPAVGAACISHARL